jgi:hypothetical protein
MMALMMFLLKILIIEVCCASLRLMFSLDRLSAAFFTSLDWIDNMAISPMFFLVG